MPKTSVPPRLQPYFDKGIQAYTHGGYEYAIDLLSFVIKHAPDATEARRYLRLAIQKRFNEQPPSSLAQAGVLVLTLPILGWAVVAEAIP